MRSSLVRGQRAQAAPPSRNNHIGQLRATPAGTTARVPPARAPRDEGTASDGSDDERALDERAARYRLAAGLQRESGTQSGVSDSESEVSSSDVLVQRNECDSPLVLTPTTRRALSARGEMELTALGALVGGPSRQSLGLDVEGDGVDSDGGEGDDEVRCFSYTAVF